jgi:hypothetical protein
MNQAMAALCVSIVGVCTGSLAHADVRPELAHTALAAIEDAKALARAGRGRLLMVGSALSTDRAPSENVVVILEDAMPKDVKPGMILILAKVGCEPVESCLIARRVTEIDIHGEVRTDAYRREELEFANGKAALLGSVTYAIDLETQSIRDMRAGRAEQSITLTRAIAEEAERIHDGAAGL